MRLDGPRGSRIIWVVNDPVDGDDWSCAQLDSIRRLLPHIRQTVRVQQALTGAGALGETLTKLLDITGLGIIQLDGRGRIIAANDRARDSLRIGDGLFDEGGFLYARTPEDDAELQGLLTRALPPFGAQGTGGSTVVTRSSALAPLVLHVNPVGREETDLRVWPVAALVLVVDPAIGAAKRDADAAGWSATWRARRTAPSSCGSKGRGVHGLRSRLQFALAQSKLLFYPRKDAETPVDGAE